jgi:hypothetical protein
MREEKLVLWPRVDRRQYEKTLRDLVLLVHQVASEGTVARMKENMKKRRKPMSHG